MGGCRISRKKCYVTFEWPPYLYNRTHDYCICIKLHLVLSRLEMVVQKQAVPTEIYGGLVKDDEDGSGEASGDI